MARFLGALRDIDGVTRVVVTQSQRTGQGGATGGGAGGSNCAQRAFITRFSIVVAFDKVPLNPATGLPGPPATTATSTSVTAPTTGNDGGVSGARQQEAAANQSAQRQTDKAHQAVSLIPGTAGP